MKYDKYHLPLGLLDEKTREIDLNSFTSNIKIHNFKEDESYEGFLLRLRKDDLTNIRKFWGFTGMSKLKKAELAHALSIEIPKNLHLKLGYIYEEIKKLFLLIIESNGSITMPYPDEIMNFLTYNLGIAFYIWNNDENNKIVIPKEIIQPLKETLNSKEIIKEINISSKIIVITTSLMYYYGAMDMFEFISLFKERYGNTCNDDLRILQTIGTSILYNDIYTITNRHIHVAYDDSYEDIINMKRKNIEYRDLSYKELQDAFSNENVVNKYTNTFKSFLNKNYNMSPYDIEDLVTSLTMDIQGGSTFSDCVGMLSSMFDFDTAEELNEVVHHLQNFYNNNPLWDLKGYSPNDISTSSSPKKIAKVIPIGRNAPCSCGSGKKYKNCCMNK